MTDAARDELEETLRSIRRNLSRILGALLLVSAASSALYTVKETNQAIITQFGTPIASVSDAGLHVKVPFIQKVRVFDKRLLEWESDPNQIPTKDKKYIWVSMFARWRIDDPMLFYQSVNNERNAQSRLDDVIDGVTNDIVTNQLLVDVVRTTNRGMISIEEGDTQTGTSMITMSEVRDVEPITTGRDSIMILITSIVKRSAEKFGIEIVDVRLNHVNYISDVKEKVYARMKSERERIAERYLAEGRGEAANIMGKVEKEVKRISSEAYRRAQEIKGRADAEAARTYANAYSESPQFYDFARSLQSYRRTMDANKTIITRSSEYYGHMFHGNSEVKPANGAASDGHKR